MATMLSGSAESVDAASSDDDGDVWVPLPADSQRRPSQSDDGVGGMRDGTVLARIVGRDFDFTMPENQRRMIIGRQSNCMDVDVKIGMSTFVSRKHLEIHRVEDLNSGKVRFMLTCKGKNGIFVNGTFQKKGAEPVELPTSYAI